MQHSAVKPVKSLIVILLIVGVVFLAGVPSAHASTVTFDSAATTTCGGAFGCQLAPNYEVSWSHTVGSGANVLIVSIAVSDPVTTVLDVSYCRPNMSGPYACIGLSYMFSEYGASIGLAVFYLFGGGILMGPGTATIHAFIGSPGHLVAGSVSYKNVAWEGPSAWYSWSSGQPQVTVAADPGDLVVDFLAMYSESAAPGSGQTPRWNYLWPTTLTGASSEKTVTSSPVTMSWTVGFPHEDWIQYAVRLHGQPPPPGGYGGGGAGTCSITLDSREDTGNTNHLGTIVAGALGYPMLPYTDSWLISSPLPYKLLYYPATVDYRFLRWEVTGGVSVTDAESWSSGMSCTGDGTLTAVYQYAPALAPSAPVGGVVMPANTFVLVSPWLALVGLVGCIGTVVTVAKPWKKPEN